MTTENKLQTQVITGKFRVSYPNVFVPKSAAPGQEAKYSISLLFPKIKNADGSYKSVLESVPADIKNAAANAIINTFGADKSKWPKGLKLPFRDGGEEDKKSVDGYGEGVWFFNASSKTKPGLVDQNMKAIIDPNKFYGGCYALASLNAYWYDKAGNRGVAFGLNNLQLHSDGEPFSARSKPENDFKSIPVPGATGAVGAAGSIEEDPFA